MTFQKKKKKKRACRGARCKTVNYRHGDPGPGTLGFDVLGYRKELNESLVNKVFYYYYLSSLHGAASRIFSAELIACVSWSVVR